MVSDASGRSRPEAYQRGPKALLRIATGIMMDQIRSLRSRAVLERMIGHKDKGVYLQIGNTCASVLRGTDHEIDPDQLCSASMNENETKLAAEMATTIKD